MWCLTLWKFSSLYRLKNLLKLTIWLSKIAGKTLKVDYQYRTRGTSEWLKCGESQIHKSLIERSNVSCICLKQKEILEHIGVASVYMLAYTYSIYLMCIHNLRCYRILQSIERWTQDNHMFLQIVWHQSIPILYWRGLRSEDTTEEGAEKL